MEKYILSRFHVKYLILLFAFVFLFSGSCNVTERKQLVGYVYVIKKHIDTPRQIVPVKNPQVTPYVYSNTCSLDTLPVPVKKQKFFDLMLPAILVAKTNLDITRRKVEQIAAKKKIPLSDKYTLERLMKRFKTNDIHVLIKRLHTFPVSIVLAQAAIESGWGSSRFFLEANNPFGIWSFNPKHSRIAASQTRDGKKVYLRKFKDLEQAIDNYYLMLATGKPFAAFREARMKTNNPDSLIRTLKMYSERREAYVDDIARVMRTSHLKRYDNFEIAPDFLRKEKTFRLFME